MSGSRRLRKQSYLGGFLCFKTHHLLLCVCVCAGGQVLVSRFPCEYIVCVCVCGNIIAVLHSFCSVRLWPPGEQGQSRCLLVVLCCCSFDVLLNACLIGWLVLSVFFFFCVCSLFVCLFCKCKIACASSRALSIELSL